MYEDNRPFRFIGVNVYSLASRPFGQGFYCGRGWTDMQAEGLIREVAEMGGKVIRLSAYQSYTRGGRDYSRLDRLMALANRHRVRLILILENQWHDCTEGGYKYASWYWRGFRKPYGRYRLSYKEHVARTVTRYRDEPAVLMWQLMNEAESQDRQNQPDPYALAHFASEMSALVKKIDPNHQLCLGTGGVNHPGSGGVWYAALANHPRLDVIEAHDYGYPKFAWPLPIHQARTVARQAGKPFVIGEVGIQSPPFSKRHRATLTMNKVKAAWSHGVTGILIWSYRAGDGTNRDFDRKDPLYRLLSQFAKSKGLGP